jgi:hypothetical protein
MHNTPHVSLDEIVFYQTEYHPLFIASRRLVEGSNQVAFVVPQNGNH